MSRRLSRPVDVQCDWGGVPILIRVGPAPLPVCAVLDDWREWFGVLFGEPERDVWIVDTPKGVYELHCVRYQPENGSEPQGQWIIERAED